MPQLMPMYWFMSIFMVVLLILIVLDFFFYKVLYKLCVSSGFMLINKNINLLW